VIGIDVGGTKMNAAFVHEDGRIEGPLTRKTKQGSQEEFLAELDGLIEEVHDGRAAALGLGLPSTIDQRAGRVVASVNIPCVDLDIRARMTERFGIPVAVDNDANAAAIAEWKVGAGRGVDNMVMLTLGTGIGGGLILDGKPWLGRGAAGEIGHMVVKRGGARCTCGRRGCMEAYAGRLAMELKARREVERGAKTDLFRIMEERGRDRLTSGVWERALEHGDHLATQLIDRAVKYLGAGIASAVNLLDPEAVIIGGGLGVRFGEKYVQRIATRMHPHLFVPDRPPVMHVAELGDLGGAIGAALLAKRVAPAKKRPRGRARAPQKAT
jgi:glucokinase